MAVPTTTITAAFRLTPMSMSTREANSTMAMRDDSAAKNRVRKNRAVNSPPKGIFSNKAGIQMKVSPVEAGPPAVRKPSTPPSSASRSGLTAMGAKAKTAGMMAMAAMTDAALLPRPVMTAFETTCSLRLT